MEFTYTTIKDLAKQTRRKVDDLIALAPQNDPFYVGTPADLSLAQWFTDLYYRFGYDRLFDNGGRIHIRRVHYQIISQKPPIQLPNGAVYKNTEECWNTLNLASKAARYLQLVQPESFDDRRNPSARLYASASRPDPSIGVEAYSWEHISLPDFPNLPNYSIGDFRADQRYHIELWCEKSTMNDVLEPLCARYELNLQTGLGELSITATLALVQRLQRIDKPARIFYISDFDPAGQSMPVAVARKLEYFIRSGELLLDVRVFPVILTLNQVRQYDLPRTPIKETERRRAGFEERHGSGAVELDALEALYPGELSRLLTRSITRYYDLSLDDRAHVEKRRLERDLIAIREQVYGAHRQAIEQLRSEYATIQREFEARIADLQSRITEKWQAISSELEDAKPALSDYPLPEGAEGREIGDGLYNSERDYLTQIDAYKHFQGK